MLEMCRVQIKRVLQPSKKSNFRILERTDEGQKNIWKFSGHDTSPRAGFVTFSESEISCDLGKIILIRY